MKTTDEIARELMNATILMPADFAVDAADYDPRLFTAITAALTAEREAREKVETDLKAERRLKESYKQSLAITNKHLENSDARADRIRAETKEECARYIENHADKHVSAQTLWRIAAAIRALGDKPHD